MEYNKPYRFLLVILSLMLPSISMANAGWPGAWVLASTSEAYRNFTILVVTSLIIEGFVLFKISKLSPLKSVFATVGANAASTAVGIGLGFALAFSDALFEQHEILSGQFVFILDLAIIFLVSVVVEAVVVRFFWKAPWKKILPIMCISNVITHGLGIYYIFTTVR